MTLAQCAERCTQITGCQGFQYRAKAKRCRPMTKRSCDSTNVFSTASAWDLEWNYYNLVPNCYTPRCYLNKISGGLSSGGELGFRKPLTLTQCADECSILAGCKAFQYRREELACRLMDRKSEDTRNTFLSLQQYQREYRYFDRLAECPILSSCACETSARQRRCVGCFRGGRRKTPTACCLSSELDPTAPLAAVFPRLEGARNSRDTCVVGSA